MLIGGAGLLAVLGADRFRATTELLVLLGLALLVPALAFRRAAFIGPALAFVGAELAYWAIESPPSVREERVVVLRRLGSVLGLAVVSAALAAFLLASSQIDVGGGLALLAAGVIAATGALALVARLARRGGADLRD